MKDDVDEIIDVEYVELDEQGKPLVFESRVFDGIMIPGVPTPPDAPRPVG